MIPVILVTGFSLYAVLQLLIGEPIVLILIVALIYLPLTVFLYLSAIRAGLIALKATGAPELKKLWGGTLRLMRFNFMLNNLIVGLLGVGTIVVLLVQLRPEVWALLNSGITAKDILAGEIITEIAAIFPIIALPILAFALSVSVGVVGTSAAATAAWTAVQGPNHDVLWGVTARFFPLFTTAAIVLVLPAFALMAWAGGPFIGVAQVMELPIIVLYGIPLYLAWAACVLSAAKALAYVQTLVISEASFQAQQDEIIGEVVDVQDLRALRQERQRRTEL